MNRPKDQPHIEILRRFLDEEVVHAFEQREEPRARIGPAERLLEVTGAQSLEVEVARRLLPLARLPSDFRFLAHRVPAAMVSEVVTLAPAGEARAAVERIARTRGS